MPFFRLFFASLFSTVVLLADPAPATAPTPAAPAHRLACVGDSITFGVGAGPDRCYPTQLGKLLGPDWIVLNFGDSGRTLLKKGNAPYWHSKRFQPALDSAPQVVVIMLGTNDTKAKNFEHIADFESDCRELVGLFQKLPSKPRVFICRPTAVIGEGKYGINEAGVLELIPIIDRVAKETGCGLIDMHTPTVGQDKAFGDRVHPNARGAALMAEAAYHAISTDPRVAR